MLRNMMEYKMRQYSCEWKCLQMLLVFLLLFVSAEVSAGTLRHIKKRSSTCLLPPYPKYGQYIVAGDPLAFPGDELEYVFLNVSCVSGMSVIGNNVAICIKGEWSTAMPQCVSSCPVSTQENAEYSCRSSGEKYFRACTNNEPIGSLLMIRCRNSRSELMVRCDNVGWDTPPVCTDECGIIPENATSLPWYASLYRKRTNIYRVSCGGSIISNKIIISAAHCFWDSDKMKNIDKSEVAVAVGKSTQAWDVTEQKYFIAGIKIPTSFSGYMSNFQSDIAILRLNKQIEYTPYIQPVCIDFDRKSEEAQMLANPGKIAIWPNLSKTSSSIFVMQLPYVRIDGCIRRSPAAFIEYISTDKMCAGSENGTEVCRGNSGAGLSFPEENGRQARFFLRGILSTAAQNYDNPDNCTRSVVTFTQISYHEFFIKDNM